MIDDADVIIVSQRRLPAFLQNTVDNKYRLLSLLFLASLMSFVFMTELRDEPLMYMIFVGLSCFSVLAFIVTLALDENSVIFGSIAFVVFAVYMFTILGLSIMGGIILYIGNQLFGWPFSWTLALAIGFVFSIIIMALMRD